MITVEDQLYPLLGRQFDEFATEHCSGGFQPILFGTILAAFKREAVEANSPGFQSWENVNNRPALPQRATL